MRDRALGWHNQCLTAVLRDMVAYRVSIREVNLKMAVISQRLLLVVALLGALLVSLSVSIAEGEAAPVCALASDFATLHELIPSAVGRCLTSSVRAGNGDELQQTSGGLLVFRRSTGSAAFTDGFHTWVNGPLGLQERLNFQRFPWERGVAKPVVLGASTNAATPTLRVLGTTIGATSGPLTFRLAGSGFRPNELVTLKGSYVPLQASPATGACRTFPLGPARVHADANGAFVITLTAANPHTGVNYGIWAEGAGSGPSNLAISAVTPNC
jgi:hypothetical protein